MSASRNLLRNRDGVTAIEFGLLAPPLMMMLMGLLDLGYNMYVNQMLHGAVQRAARDSSLEGAAGQQTAINNLVKKAVQHVVPSATFSITRDAYINATDINRPESWNDVDADGTCAGGETFEDANGNGTWDSSMATSGFGGARASVMFTVKVSYDRAFPVYVFIPGQTKRMTLTSKTVLRNQPYDVGAIPAPTIGTCA